MRATAAGWLVCARDACEGESSGCLAPAKGDVAAVVAATVGAVVAVSRWRRRDIACVRARRGGGGDDDDVAADRFG